MREPSVPEKLRRLRSDARREDQLGMAHRQDDAFGHAVDFGFFQPDHAVVHTRQPAEHARKADRRAACDNAERRPIV